MLKWFKELFTLIAWLFSSRPSDCKLGELKVVQMRHFPFSGYKYMMWCGRIITRKDKAAVEKEFIDTAAGRRSMTHETIHCVQAIAEHGDNWLRYYWMYFVHWLKRNPLTHPASACYYCNRYEVEAYANEDDPDYWVVYSRDNLKYKYDIKGAKKMFRKLGKMGWKDYIKTL